MIIHNAVITGSFNVNGSDVSSITGSTTYSASFASQINSLNSYTASINDKTSSFATTGSNTFVGNQVVSGSLTTSGSITATGTLTAQTLVVQTVTSSVVYSSGSNIFGNNIANTQVMTGSVLVTGSIGVGVTIPSALLHVRDTANTVQATFGLNDSATGTQSSSIDLISRNSANTSGYTFRVQNDANAAKTYLIYNTSASLTVSSSGYIGIGNTSPTRQLFVNDTVFFDNAGSGTTTNPSVAIGSTSLGISYLGGSNMALITNATTKMYISASGNIGIGTNSPSYSLDVSGTGRFTGNVYLGTSSGLVGINTTTLTAGIPLSINVATGNNCNIAFQENASDKWYLRNITSTNGFSFYSVAGSTEVMRLTSGGNVGIGITNPTDSDGYGGKVLDVNGPGYFRDNSDNTKYVSIGSVSNIGFIEANGTNNYLRIYTGGTGEKVRITSTGYFKQAYNGSYLGAASSYNEFSNNVSGEPGIATTIYGASIADAAVYLASFETDHNNTTAMYLRGRGGATTRIRIYSNGTIQNSTGTYGTLSSDIRLKENIVDASSKLEDIMRLRVVNFNFKQETKKQIGFVAQEFQEVFPSLVQVSDTREYDKEGNVIRGLEDSLGLNVGMEFAILTKAIQELKSEFDAYKATHP